MEFLKAPTRVLFFTGKGGVGKTLVACAAAVKLADPGKRVLLISTDPASNLDEVLGVTLGNTPTAVPGVPNLKAMNIDPEASAKAYRESMVAPYRGVIPDAAVASMEEQFSGSCTLEIAAFDEFARLLGGTASTGDFDHVLFDTAPTGHTLRLLSLPSAWDGFLSANTTGTSCLGPLAGLQAQQKLYADTVKALGDPAATTLVLVARPDEAALREAERTSGELAALGVRNQHLVVNGVFRAVEKADPVAVAMERRADKAVSRMPVGLTRLPRTVIPLAPNGLVGIDAVRAMGSTSVQSATAPAIPAPDVPPLGSLIDDLARQGHGVIMTMGKGGVGKTTVAAAVAVALADRGFNVRLSTTDPAAHVAAALNGEVTNLTVSRIDPKAETAAYAAEVMATAGKDLDAKGRAMLEEDLRSPCTEETAVFRAFAAAVAEGAGGFVVLDTAPTGHTILLLDSALAYHREVTRQASGMPEAVGHLLPRLRDPEFTRVLIVTLPEATPVHEAAKLQADLTRAGIAPFAWVINQCLTPLIVTDPVLMSRRAHEARYVREVVTEHTRRAAMIAWQVEPPIGRGPLLALTTTTPSKDLVPA
ncbi:arsenical pump-driving ATPase [Gemmata sp.]|uniref:arsenical pump-driving ATPase n=1 Tax=Gemmata sp. TaxID=1914242 RepID=UPI003F6F3959